MKPLAINKEKGSVLVLVLITAMILSIMTIGLLTVGSTEMATSRNQYLKKVALYHAVEGLSVVANRVVLEDDPAQIYVEKLDTTSKTILDTLREKDKKSSIAKTYYTGNLMDGQGNVSEFFDFPSPPPMGVSIGLLETTPYKVEITSEILLHALSLERFRKRAYSEIIAGVYKVRQGNQTY